MSSLTLYARDFEHRMDMLIGSYARNVVYSSTHGHVCPVCGGPKQDKYSFCISCERERQQAKSQNLALADMVRISIYASEYDDQAYRVMEGYKNLGSPAVKDYQNVVKYILGDALMIHRACIPMATGATPTSWSVVPSSKSSPRYGTNSVLARLVSPHLSDIPMLSIVSKSAKKRAVIAPDAFALETTPNPDALNHVLLIDDS